MEHHLTSNGSREGQPGISGRRMGITEFIDHAKNDGTIFSMSINVYFYQIVETMGPGC